MFPSVSNPFLSRTRFSNKLPIASPLRPLYPYAIPSLFPYSLMSSKRGRKRNDNLPPNRARDVQRAFRARRAAHLQVQFTISLIIFRSYSLYPNKFISPPSRHWSNESQSLRRRILACDRLSTCPQLTGSPSEKVPRVKINRKVLTGEPIPNLNLVVIPHRSTLPRPREQILYRLPISPPL